MGTAPEKLIALRSTRSRNIAAGGRPKLTIEWFARPVRNCRRGEVFVCAICGLELQSGQPYRLRLPDLVSLLESLSAASCHAPSRGRRVDHRPRIKTSATAKDADNALDTFSMDRRRWWRRSSTRRPWVETEAIIAFDDTVTCGVTR